MRVSRLSWCLGVLVAASISPVPAEDRRFEIGPRMVITANGGEPANDMIATGLYGEYRLSRDRWFVGAAVDVYAYDFERPWLILGLEQDGSQKVIDADAEAVIVSGWIGKEHGAKERRLHWVWSTGLGFSSPSVKDVRGPLQGSGTFDITTNPGTEIILSATGGLRHRLGQRWSLQFGVRVDHHFSEWKVLDRESGRTGTTGDYTGLGGHFGLGFRF